MEDNVNLQAIAGYVLEDFFDTTEEERIFNEVICCLALADKTDRRIRAKTQGFYERTVPGFFLDTFKRFFRMTRGTVELLCQFLARCRQLRKRSYRGGRDEVPLQKKVLMTLRYLASQENIMEISDRFGVTEYSFLKHHDQVIDSINSQLMHKFIKWPSNEEMNTIATKFNDMGTHLFPGIIGAVDGSHIRIEPPSENPQAYFNRKKFHSLILQGVCKDDMQFIHINIGWPGRVHDAKVLRNSDLWDTGFERCQFGRFHILGDGAYPIKVWLLTPYRDTGHLARNQTMFNKSLSSKRQVIERAFGLLKGRFRRLKYINKRSIQQMCCVIQTACILHNVCICNGEDLEEFLGADSDDDDDDASHAVPWQENDAEGTLKRFNITNRV